MILIRIAALGLMASMVCLMACNLDDVLTIVAAWVSFLLGMVVVFLTFKR